MGWTVRDSNPPAGKRLFLFRNVPSSPYSNGTWYVNWYLVNWYLVRPIQPLFKWYLDSFSRGKQPGNEADHSPLCSAEIKNAWSYTSIPAISLHGVEMENFNVFYSSGM